jgi:uncharacterized protein
MLLQIYINNTFKESNIKSVKIAVKNNKKYEFEKKWEDVNKEFSMMNMNVIILRIYIRRTFKNSTEYEEKRDLILKTVFDETLKLEKYTK